MAIEILNAAGGFRVNIYGGDVNCREKLGDFATWREANAFAWREAAVRDFVVSDRTPGKLQG